MWYAGWLQIVGLDWELDSWILMYESWFPLILKGGSLCTNFKSDVINYYVIDSNLIDYEAYINATLEWNSLLLTEKIYCIYIQKLLISY